MRVAAHVGVKDEVELIGPCLDHLRRIGVGDIVVQDMAEYVRGGAPPDAAFNHLLHETFGANLFPNLSFAGALGVLASIDEGSPLRLSDSLGLDAAGCAAQAAAIAAIRRSGVLRPELFSRR